MEAVASQSAAVVVMQKSYRGYRARRQLADAAIMAKSFGWWNLMDSVVLQEQTQLYYAHSESQKASDNWKRLNRKAAKVGKGLSKDSKALKLALQHWLEAIDARHRYGANLRPYYLYWLQLETHEPFFYWLDVGGGRKVDLSPSCSRAKLTKEMIRYLGPEQRKHYRVEIHDGRFFFQQSGDLVHTTDSDSSDDRWIFVMSPDGKLYIGKKERGVFQHSSFLAGGTTVAAGRLSIHKGVLQLMEAHSGHYRPSPENFQSLIRILFERGADLSLAKVHLVSDDLVEEKQGKQLAGEVRGRLQGVVEEEHGAVTVEQQSLVSLDSGLELVTDLTFPAAGAPASPAKEKRPKDEKEQEQERRSAGEVPVVSAATGCSRNSSLAGLQPEKREEALRKVVAGR